MNKLNECYIPDKEIYTVIKQCPGISIKDKKIIYFKYVIFTVEYVLPAEKRMK